jgi:hypothetical protein
MTSDHRVAGSSPAGCKTIARADLQAIEATRKSVTERETYHSLTTFEVYPQTSSDARCDSLQHDYLTLRVDRFPSGQW